ncbi:YnbE family lipoprotein [Erythrobacter sp. GH1-10]|uniref:YnbE family lipoprotein n=1 Tax=Erythrobacter sp. GH1-10 TaxID=3349334 RepID=UPI003877C25E
MIHEELTDDGMVASHRMMSIGFLSIARRAFVVGAALVASGCININAPDEAIVIELNINIQADIAYRLAEDAGNAIDENADIF